MSPTRAPLRIEIVDPANDLPGEGWTRHAAVATAPTGFDEWLGSLTDAGGAVVGHLGPLTRGLSRSVARGRRVWRAAHDRSWRALAIVVLLAGLPVNLRGHRRTSHPSLPSASWPSG